MNKNNKNKEIEVRFLEIDTPAVVKKLKSLGASDLGKEFLKEIIFYDQAGRWQYQEKKYVRLRKTKKGSFLVYKDQSIETATGTHEIEFKVEDFEKTKSFLEAIGLVAFREQEKKRHSFKLERVVIDIDTWPKVPTYLEIEGPSEKALKQAAKKIGLNWSQVVFESARFVIERHYKIPVSKLHYFTFDRLE